MANSQVSIASSVVSGYTEHMDGGELPDLSVDRSVFSSSQEESLSQTHYRSLVASETAVGDLGVSNGDVAALLADAQGGSLGFLKLRHDLDTRSSLSRPGTTRRRGRVRIKKPKALTGSSYITVCLAGLHYMILCFIFMGGWYFNDRPPPFMLFIIPGFAAGAALVVSVLCLLMQGTWVIRKLCEPSTGMKVSILGTLGCGVWSLIVYGPLRNDYTQAIELFQTCGVMVLYYLLVRRRLTFASIAFAAGAKAISRLKALWFRILVHAIWMLVYCTGWSVVYLQLLRLPQEETDNDETATESIQTTPSPNEGFPGLEPGASLLPAWISEQIRTGLLRTIARVYLIYNILIVTQAIKGSVWLSISASVSSISLAARTGGAVRLKSQAQLNTKFRESLPSLAVSGHLQLLAGLLRAVTEGMRRCRTRRSGVLHNLGALLLTVCKPIIMRVNVMGLIDMGMSERNLLAASKYSWEELERVGMSAVVNDDVLFGARICSNLFFASASSILGRLLVEFFNFPLSMTLEVATMCFIISFFIGNLGIEAGEAWAVSLHLQFARAPECLYVANPEFANAIHCILFGLPVSTKPQERKKGETGGQEHVEEEMILDEVHRSKQVTPHGKNASEEINVLGSSEIQEERENSVVYILKPPVEKNDDDSLGGFYGDALSLKKAEDDDVDRVAGVQGGRLKQRKVDLATSEEMEA